MDWMERYYPIHHLYRFRNPLQTAVLSLLCSARVQRECRRDDNDAAKLFVGRTPLLSSSMHTVAEWVFLSLSPCVFSVQKGHKVLFGPSQEVLR